MVGHWHRECLTPRVKCEAPLPLLHSRRRRSLEPSPEVTPQNSGVPDGLQRRPGPDDARGAAHDRRTRGAAEGLCEVYNGFWTRVGVVCQVRMILKELRTINRTQIRPTAGPGLRVGSGLESGCCAPITAAG